MARYRDSKCKLCRNEGAKLFLKGDRCYTQKCAFDRRPYGTGPHGQARKKMSEYAIQLREKQKVRRTYGVLEKPFYNTFVAATRQKGVTGTILLQRLETRLDNIIYRSGLALSRSHARQLVMHGHVLVNGKRVDIPSYLVSLNDQITFAPKSHKDLKAQLELRASAAVIPGWLEANLEKLEAKMILMPERQDVDATLKENLIIEYYSR
ncbi:MAG: 30S ribosomal protein S4 [Vampirovibrionales bacterium]|nr:30S ribosomal protein S4 [Vampirovibrionales bacterium]